jgi:hypothetical protein
MIELLDTIECTCVNCKQVKHIPRWEHHWTCYSCGRGNRTHPKVETQTPGEDPFAEFLEYNGAHR